jgi:hypothetical protein
MDTTMVTDFLVAVEHGSAAALLFVAIAMVIGIYLALMFTRK